MSKVSAGGDSAPIKYLGGMMTEMFHVDNATYSDSSSLRLRHQTLHQCARSGDVEGLTLLLDQNDVRHKINHLDDNGLTPLHYAARANKFEVVELLINNEHANPNARDGDGATPFHYVAKKSQKTPCEDTRRIIQLFRMKSDVNVRDKYGSTPLHIAAMRGNLPAAEELVERCPDIIITCQDQLGCTPLHNCATYNEVDVARFLIASGATKFRVDDNDQCSPLHLACMEGHTDIARLLVENADSKTVRKLITSEDKEGTASLHYAIESHDFDIVKLLVDYGASVNQPCRAGSTGSSPLHLAATAGEEDIARLLLEHGAAISSTNNRGATPIHRAAQFGERGVLQLLLAKLKTSVDIRDMELSTPLLTAITYGNEELVADLLEFGADINAQDIDDKGAIFLAAENENMECLEELLKYIQPDDLQALVNDMDMSGNTAIHVAANKGRNDMVTLLLDNKADPDAKNENEETPFLIAAWCGQMDIVQELLARNERVVNDEDENGNTALHMAAEQGHLEVARVLIEFGADKEARNGRAWTPLDISAYEGQLEIVKLLLNEYVSPNPIDKEKVTPLHLAAKHGHGQVVSALLEGGADVAAVDIYGRNCLDLAISHGHRSIVTVILNSKVWYVAMANECNHERGQPRTTPLRRLINRMPELVPLAMSKFMTYGPDHTSAMNSKRYVELNFDYFDDTYVDYNELRSQEPLHLSEREDILHPTSANPYCNDTTWIKRNHPITLLLKKARESNQELANHPMVLALIRQKWEVARVIYFIYLAFYCVFLALVTTYMDHATPPYLLNLTDCTVLGVSVQSTFEKQGTYAIWAFAGLGLLAELIQMAAQRWMYFGAYNLIDWFCYVSAIILVINIGECDSRTNWQWQLGCFTVLFVWLSLLIYIRRLPTIGIYVVMVEEIFKTFMQFFVVFFLFIIAFALCFSYLFQGQAPFSTPGYSIVRTWVMMMQEFDYEDMFFNPDEPVVYRGTSYAIFIMFLILVAIIINNLLTGLAIDDVNTLREYAKVVKLRIHVELALDIELAMPRSWRLRYNGVVRRLRLRLNQTSSSFRHFWYKIQRIVEGPQLCYKNVVDAAKSMDEGQQIAPLEEVEERLQKQMKKTLKHVFQLKDKMDNMEKILVNLESHLVKPNSKPARVSRRYTSRAMDRS